MPNETNETGYVHDNLTNELSGKIVDKVTRVSCDEGFTIHFSDGTKLEAGWSNPYGDALVNNEQVECEGYFFIQKLQQSNA